MKPRSAVNAPRIAVTPIASGRLAAATLPKMITSSTITIGRDSDSARPMSWLTCSLMSRLSTVTPPTRVSSPGAASSPSIEASPSRRCSSSPASRSTA